MTDKQSANQLETINSTVSSTSRIKPIQIDDDNEDLR